jgi:hypothetical protein
LRIAISGSHATGKSTLLRELASLLPHYQTVDEPYDLLEEAGHRFSDPPRNDDFIALVEYSASLYLRNTTADIVFDRSPADYLAYLAAGYANSIRPDHLAVTADALATVDLVILVPIERPDCVVGADAPKLRRRVDGILREMLIDHAWPFSPSTIEVTGSSTQRAEQVLTALTSLRQRTAPPRLR